MKKKSTNILSNKSAAAIKAELAKYSETFNVKDTQKLVVDGEIIDVNSVNFEAQPGALQVVAPIPLTT